MKRFWDYAPKERFPPSPIENPGELESSDRLNVACTQTDLSPSAQRKLVRSWCARLPKLEGVKFLWLSSRVSQPLFDAACEVPGLEGLWVKWSGVKNVDALEKADSLRYFHLGSSSGLVSLGPLASKRDLRWLGIENVKRVSSLDPIARLRRLEGLTVEGSMWSPQRIESLSPIGELTNLRYLGLANLRATDGTLRPLFKLSRLEEFVAAEWWNPAEVAELRRRNPGLAV